MALKETRHHYPSDERGQNAGPSSGCSSDVPNDIDTHVEESHEESYVASSQHQWAKGSKRRTQALKSVSNQEHANRSGLLRRNHSQYIKRDDADEHHGEDQEGPSRCEGGQVMGFIEPDHEHGETHEERERNVDPEQVVNEFGIDVA